MDDNDQLYIPIFDDEEEGGDDTSPDREEGQNRSFLIGAIVLAAVFVLGICAIVIYLLVLRPQQTQQATDNSIELTNAVLIQTATAQVEAQLLTESAPTTGPAATEEAQATEERPSPTPTSDIRVTVVGTEETAEPGAGTEEATREGTVIAEVTAGPGTASATPLSRATGSPGAPTATATPRESGIIQVTPLGGGQPTPTRVSQGTPGTPSGGTQAAGATPTRGGIGGPVQPTAVQTALPETGFEGGTGLAGAGVLAVLLVAVVVIARRLRF